MAYVRRTWLARAGTNLNRFLKSGETANEVILTNDPTTITEAGTPFTADAMNNIEDGIEEALAGVGMQFDLIVDSDAKLAAWAASGTWERVLIRKGTYTLASGGVDLTARGTKVVIGETGSRLVFTAAPYGLYYSALPQTNDYYMHGVNVTISALTTDYGAAFKNCFNLAYCTADVIVVFGITGASFTACYYLSRCTANISGTGANDIQGFASCYHVTDCIGTASLNGTSRCAGFAACFYTRGCTAYATNAGSGSAWGIANCFACLHNHVQTYKTAKYNTSYASTDTTAACADTAAGGWNS